MYTEEQRELETHERPTDKQLGINNGHEAYCATMDAIEVAEQEQTVSWWAE